MDDGYQPPEELAKKLRIAVPMRGDWCLYCPKCEYIGEANAAFIVSRSMNTHNWTCLHQMRIWRNL